MLIIVTILGSRKSRPTGRLLAESLHARYTEESSNDGIVIRYGNSYSRDSVSGQTINTQEAVSISSNKPRCKSLLTEQNIPTPRRISFQDALAGNCQFPVVVRRNNHFKGKFFYLVSNQRNLRKYNPETHYIQEYVDKIDEYRLFIMKDRIIEADLKELPEGHTNPVRNFETGCFFRWVRVSSLSPDLKRAVRNAVQTCGLDFAAVDCATIRTPDGIKPTIFEINSAPGLIDRKIELFTNKLHELYLD